MCVCVSIKSQFDIHQGRKDVQLSSGVESGAVANQKSIVTQLAGGGERRFFFS